MIIYDDDGIGHDVIPTQAVKDAIAEIESYITGKLIDFESDEYLRLAVEILKKHTGIGANE